MEIDRVSIAHTQFVSAQQIDVTLGGAAELTGKRAVVGSVEYYPAIPSAPDNQPATTRYMLPLRTFTSGEHDLPELGTGNFIIQNPNLTPMRSIFESPNLEPMEIAPVTIPAGALYVYPNTELNLSLNILAVASKQCRSRSASEGCSRKAE